MTAYILDVKDLPKFEYFQLSENVRPFARQAILDAEIKGIKRSIASARLLAKQNVNKLVNDPYHISRILRSMNHLRSLSDVNRLEKFIDSNWCSFLADGTYIYYFAD